MFLIQSTSEFRDTLPSPPPLNNFLNEHWCHAIHADDKPSLSKLTTLRTSKGKRIKIIETVAPKWQKIGDLLDFDESGTRLELIKATHPSDPEACCRSMFQHWLKGNGVKPCSWRKLIELLEDSNFESLAKEVETILSEL